MNALVSTRDDHPFVAIMALPDPPEADPFLMSKNFSKRKIRRRGLRLVEDTPFLITKGALATDTFKRVEHDAYPGRNKAAAIVASLPAFTNRR
jgi:hypothetical protein